MTDQSDDRGLELGELFFETSQELVQALNEEALKLEKTPGDEEIVRAIRRTVHTLKGDSAACGLRELSELAHQFEDALSVEGAAGQTAIAEIAVPAADLFSEMIVAYHGGEKVPESTGLKRRIQELTSAPAPKKSRKKKAPPTAPAAGAQWTAQERQAMAQAQAEGFAVYQVVAKIDPHCAMPIAGRQLVYNALVTTGRVIAQRPDPKSTATLKQVEFVLASAETPEKITTKAKVPTIVEEVAIDLLLAAAPSPAPVPEQKQAEPPPQATDTQPLESQPAETSPTEPPSINPDPSHAKNVFQRVGRIGVDGRRLLPTRWKTFFARK